jgi:hypothetical protein
VTNKLARKLKDKLDKMKKSPGKILIALTARDLDYDSYLRPKKIGRRGRSNCVLPLLKNLIYPSMLTSIVKLPASVLKGTAILGPLTIDMSLWFFPVTTVGMAP